MEKLEIMSLQKKGDLTKPDKAERGDRLHLPINFKPQKVDRTNYERVQREISQAAAEEAKERQKQKQLEKAEELANSVQRAGKKRRLIVRHNTHRDGILLENWKKVLDLNENCKALAWRLATTPGGKSDPDWYPTFKALQKARKKRDKAIRSQERAWEFAKKGLDWKKEHDKENAERYRKTREAQKMAKAARKRALADANRLDLLEHENRLLQMKLAAAQAKSTQWARVEEGRKRYIEAHGEALPQ